MTIRPTGVYAKRQLNWIWLVDCSGSMRLNDKILTLNYAIREAIPAMRDQAAKNSESAVIVRTLKFANGAHWMTREGTPLVQFSWIDVEADSEDATVGEQTHLGAAFQLLAEELRTFPTMGRYLSPVLVLITDGEPTDDWRGPLKELLSVPWAQHAMRFAITVGSGTKLEPLKRFINNPEFQPVRAYDTNMIVHQALSWNS
jgi:uncharacterized protein YegL